MQQPRSSAPPTNTFNAVENILNSRLLLQCALFAAAVALRAAVGFHPYSGMSLMSERLFELIENKRLSLTLFYHV